MHYMQYDCIFANMFRKKLRCVLFSLPGVLMIWSCVNSWTRYHLWGTDKLFLIISMFFFFVAFCLQCLQNSGTVTRSIVGPSSFSMIVLIMWCLQEGRTLRTTQDTSLIGNLLNQQLGVIPRHMWKVVKMVAEPIRFNSPSTNQTETA